MRPFTDTVFIGKELHHLPRVDSTNSYLRELLRSSQRTITEGTVVIADEQFAGRGQGSSLWDAQAYLNLTCSILLTPKFLLPQHIFYLNKAIALATRDTVGILTAGSDIDITIKWPNDIYAISRKLGGILIENTFNAGIFQHCIVGVGLNVNQSEFDPHLPNPASLRQFTGQQYIIEDVLHVLCSQVEKQYLQLLMGQMQRIDDAYHTHLYGWKKSMNLRAGDMEFEGEIDHVDQNGLLVVKTTEGIKTFHTKEISFLF